MLQQFEEPFLVNRFLGEDADINASNNQYLSSIHLFSCLVLDW